MKDKGERISQLIEEKRRRIVNLLGGDLTTGKRCRRISHLIERESGRMSYLGRDVEEYLNWLRRTVELSHLAARKRCRRIFHLVEGQGGRISHLAAGTIYE